MADIQHATGLENDAYPCFLPCMPEKHPRSPVQRAVAPGIHASGKRMRCILQGTWRTCLRQGPRVIDQMSWTLDGTRCESQLDMSNGESEFVIWVRNGSEILP